MKRYIPLLALLLASQLYPQSKMDINNLIDRGGLKYAPNDDEPYKGKVFDFYENGQKKLDGNYRKGLMNGKWTYYHENGQIHGQGRFIDGDGNTSSESSGIPFNGRTGRWTFWYDNGQKDHEEIYKNGKPNGLFTGWYDNGQKKEKGIFKDGTPANGKWIFWHKNGQKLQELTYKNGKVEGLLTQWYENGENKQEKIFKNGELVTRMEWEYYENGKKKKEKTYKNGELVSRMEWEYYENGKKKQERSYKNDEWDGTITWWNEEEQRYIKSTINDIMQEALRDPDIYKVTTWFENGQKSAEGAHKDGKEDGEWTWWYENGQKRWEGYFKDNKQDGLWTSWYDNGNKMFEGTYKDGERISGKCWDEDGNEKDCN